MLPGGAQLTTTSFWSSASSSRGLIGRDKIGRPGPFWYYTPMAMAFSGELDCDFCVYDNMDELSLFPWHIPESCWNLESVRFSRRADPRFHEVA